MRNRRLLTLAVLAVALGFATFAQAETAIVTVVESGTTFDIRYSISGGVSIGSTASTPGALDVVIKSIQGLEGATVDSVSITAPEASVTGTSGTYAAGFNGTTGIRNVTLDANSGSYSAVLLQPAAYDDPCTAPSGPAAWTPEQDAGVLIGIGTTGALATDQPNPAYYPTVNWEGGDGTGPAYSGDTLLFSGTYTAGTGTYGVGVSTYGTDSFSVLDPTDPNGRFTGPDYENLYVDNPAVQAVVIQHSSAANGGGTVAPTVATTLKVEYGDVVLGADYASSTFVTLQVTDGNTSITLGADHNIGGLDLQTAGAGYQVVDVDASRLNIYGGDQATIEAMVGGASDGLYSSQVDLANEVLVVGDMGDHIAVLATINGDGTLDGTVDDSDFFVLINHWKQAADFVTGDWTGDDLCDDSDFFVLINNWKQSFVPTGGAAVPEPATMSLLGLGVIGLLSRRRRRK